LEETESIKPNRNFLSAFDRTNLMRCYDWWLIIVARQNPRERIPTTGIRGKDCAVHGCRCSGKKNWISKYTYFSV